jgi:hypothetical protein
VQNLLGKRNKHWEDFRIGDGGSYLGRTEGDRF